MTKNEQQIRYHVGLEIIENVYQDYLSDKNNSKEDCKEFMHLLQDMHKFYRTKLNTTSKDT